jgi:hypothetical protein
MMKEHHPSWWLQLTAPPQTQDYATASSYSERDRLRKAGLISGIAPVIFFAPLLLMGQATVDPITITSILACMVTAILVLILNRQGKQTLAALLLIAILDAVIEIALIRAPGGLGDAWLLTFDLFLFPLFLPGMLFSRRAIWFFLALHIACILGDFYLLPHTPDLDTLITHWGQSVAYARPILLEIGLGLLCFFQVRSTDQAIVRADRAEELASLEREISAQKQQLEMEIQRLSEALTLAANGHFNARVTAQPGNILWDVENKLNTLLTRLQSSRHDIAQFRQTEVDVARLREAVSRSRQGEQAIWPLPNGGILDGLIAEVRLTLTEHKTKEGTPPSSSLHTHIQPSQKKG